MTVPALQSLEPAAGAPGGGDLVRLTGTGIADAVEVRLGDARALVLGVHHEAGASFVDARTPAHAPAIVDVTLWNLDASGAPVPGETATLAAAYRYLRPRLAREADLTRLVRALIQELKRQVLVSARISVAVDYRDPEAGNLELVTLAELPGLVLTGPQVAPNRFYARNEAREDLVPGPSGPEIRRHRPTYTVDLGFTLTAASSSTVELLNLMAAVGIFLGRNRWLTLPRDPEDPALGSVRWELDPEGEIRPQLDGPDDLRAFTCGLVVRGFDLDEGQPLDRGKAVAGLDLGAMSLERSVP
ncbi:MAG: transcription factor [Polyangia bacterium]|jgi:hypothetical protein|nr:transcription factor [Polyangia bacterium]